MANEKQKKFDDLVKALENDEEVAIRILPNGEIVPAPGSVVSDVYTGKKYKPLTMREDLGGEYAA